MMNERVAAHPFQAGKWYRLGELRRVAAEMGRGGSRPHRRRHRETGRRSPRPWPRELRRAFGVNLLKICDQTGHKSLEMLRVYCRRRRAFRRQCGRRATV